MTLVSKKLTAQRPRKDVRLAAFIHGLNGMKMDCWKMGDKAATPPRVFHSTMPDDMTVRQWRLLDNSEKRQYVHNKLVNLARNLGEQDTTPQATLDPYMIPTAVSKATKRSENDQQLATALQSIENFEQTVKKSHRSDKIIEKDNQSRWHFINHQIYDNKGRYWYWQYGISKFHS